MTRDKWRELCKRTPKGRTGAGHWFHISTYLVPVDGTNLYVYARKGSTYHKGMETREI